MDSPLYPGIAGSPETTLTATYIAGISTSISVNNGSVLPAAPNYITILTGTERNAMFCTVEYAIKEDNTLSGLTLQEGMSMTEFPPGSPAARLYTAADQQNFINAIHEHTEQLTELSTETQAALDTKVNVTNPVIVYGVPANASKRYLEQDDNGEYLLFESRRQNGTLQFSSTLSADYATRTERYYAENGTTVEQTLTFAIVYDTNGFVIGETLS